jgi:hypothetical protein
LYRIVWYCPMEVLVDEMLVTILSHWKQRKSPAVPFTSWGHQHVNIWLLIFPMAGGSAVAHLGLSENRVAPPPKKKNVETIMCPPWSLAIDWGLIPQLLDRPQWTSACQDLCRASESCFGHQISGGQMGNNRSMGLYIYMVSGPPSTRTWLLSLGGLTRRILFIKILW